VTPTRARRSRARRKVSQLIAIALLALVVVGTLVALHAPGSRPARAGFHAIPRRVLPHDPNFVAPSYYKRFAHGPSSSLSYFPIYTYQLNLGQWNRLAARIKAMGVGGIDNAYDGSSLAGIRLGARHGLTYNVALGRPSRHVAPARGVTSYAMLDEPDNDGSPFAASSCAPSHDSCAHAYVELADAYRAADQTRPVWGNFTKDVEEWSYPPTGWTPARWQQHIHVMIRALDIVSADYYAWTDPYEWTQGSGNTGTGHIGSWVYGHTIDRLRFYDRRIPVYGFVECCGPAPGPQRNIMMPGMIQSAAWNILVHGGRGIVWWTTDFWDSDSGGDPHDRPYAGATYWGNYALYGDHQWDAQYDAARQVDAQISALAPKLNSPTVTGISARSPSGVPVSALGKDYGGKLWLVVQADGNQAHPLSNTTPIRATIQLPSVVRAGTVLEVIGEHRTVKVNGAHRITDAFATTTETLPYAEQPLTYGYQHHIYAMS
jgi:hypothetical protein